MRVTITVSIKTKVGKNEIGLLDASKNPFVIFRLMAVITIRTSKNPKDTRPNQKNILPRFWAEKAGATALPTTIPT